MSGNPALRVVLCWHMHQPPYQDPIGGRFQSPWTYLHGLKDYVDMAAHLEAVPEAKAVVNFTPVLLEQIEDYAKQMASAARGQDNVHDPLLAALAHPVSVGSDESRLSLVKACLRADRKRLIDRFPPFARLASIADWAIGHPEGLIYLNDQFLIDLVVWYHLAWLGETVRREDATAQRLMAQGRNFTLNDRQELLGLMADLMGGIIPRYRTLAQRGQIELSVTPFSHPIIPLLLGFDRARETMSNVALPLSPSYPGGEARARWQIEHSKEVFGRHFGYIPAGVWPAEGGVCPRTLELLGEAGFKWTATGQGVLHNSLGHSHLGTNELHRPYRLGGSPACFFRDDGLSDKIGFVYRDWHADDAVANLVHELETLARSSNVKPGRVVSIILDGENAWEYYHENAYYFLSGLYRALVAHPAIELTTFSECLEQTDVACHPLERLVSGSWVYGNFATWIGDPEKNRAWDMLVDAKRIYDEVMAAGTLSPEAVAAAEKQLAWCEASDWFWWLGDNNPESAVSQFERLLRLHLSALYQCLGRSAPNYLSYVFAKGMSGGTGSSMRPAH
ncbi:MAG: glycoside hydrolase family 57 protein [Pseudomonadota bacterium]|nr:glycoside hydrolase family 57 protein [Pseudomonadota bacterium]